MGRPVAIIGVGQTKHGKRMDVSYPDLVREAVLKVFEDTGLTTDDIDGVVSGTMPSMMEGVALTHFYFADAMQAVGKPILKTETCGSTGVSIAHTAFYWVASGMADMVLAVGHEKMNEGDSQATMTTVVEPFYQRYFIAVTIAEIIFFSPEANPPNPCHLLPAKSSDGFFGGEDHGACAIRIRAYIQEPHRGRNYLGIFDIFGCNS